MDALPIKSDPTEGNAPSSLPSPLLTPRLVSHTSDGLPTNCLSFDPDYLSTPGPSTIMSHNNRRGRQLEPAGESSQSGERRLIPCESGSKHCGMPADCPWS